MIGQAGTVVLSRVLTVRTDVLVQAPLGRAELHFVAGFVGAASLLALLPAAAITRTRLVPALRA